jgi:hypothetical protein
VVNHEPVSVSCARSGSRPFGLRPAGPATECGGIDGKVIQLSQLSKHGDVDRGTESQLELPKIGDLVADEELADSAGGKDDGLIML